MTQKALRRAAAESIDRIKRDRKGREGRLAQVEL